MWRKFAYVSSFSLLESDILLLLFLLLLMSTICPVSYTYICSFFKLLLITNSILKSKNTYIASICFDTCLRVIADTSFNKQKSSSLSLKIKGFLACFYKQNFPLKHFVHILQIPLQRFKIITLIIYHLPLQIDISPNKNDEYAQCW